MKQPGIDVKSAMADISVNIPEKVNIPGTGRYVRIKGLKPYTIERLTRLWQERDLTRNRDVSERISSDPYFNHRVAAIFVLNGFWSLKLFYGLLWRWYAFLRQYTQEQLWPIISAGKKKIPLYSYWMNMVLTLDMRNDWMTMTEKEAESYQAELILAEKRRSSKNTQPMQPH